MRTLYAACLVVAVFLPLVAAEPLKQEPNTWVKRSPVKDGPPSPGMGYETSLCYDPVSRLVIRWGGHNQGGGGEQNAETWTYDPAANRWALKEPNTSPPGVCCAQQNLFDPVGGQFLRFPAFSGSHGWQWFREIYLSNSTVWSYHLPTNTWRDRRPVPAPRVHPLRCASWDSDHQVAVIFAGEGSSEGTVVYDPFTNAWTRMRPRSEPPGRSSGNMAYDAARKVHLLFGSQFTDDPRTWAYDLARNEWRDLKPAEQPPTNRNDAVLAYDSANKVVVALVRAADKTDGMDVTAGHLETWAFDAGKNTWTKRKPAREPDGWGNRRRVMIYLPDQNLSLCEVYANPSERIPGVDREQQIWTYRYDEPKPDDAPRPATRLEVATKDRSARLTWTASPSPDVTGYTIHRGVGAQPWSVEYKEVGKVGIRRTVFDDDNLEPGKVHWYFVRAVTKDGKASADSEKVRTQPPVVEDVVVSVASAKEVKLTWNAPPGDVSGYHVERAPVEVLSEDEIVRLKKDTNPLAEPSVGAVKAIGKFSRLTREPLRNPGFTDTSLDLTKPHTAGDEPLFRHRFSDNQLDPKGKPYRHAVFAYRVRAVNALGVEGGPGPYFLTIPSAVQWVFSKEDGEKCHLKWKKNAEAGIKGYRVYRMEGPKINGPGQPVTRLTADPLDDDHYTDERATKDTKRYWIVAVDALGQEGIPSAPTWHWRQYRKHYEGFVGEWHQ